MGLYESYMISFDRPSCTFSLVFTVHTPNGARAIQMLDPAPEVNRIPSMIRRLRSEREKLALLPVKMVQLLPGRIKIRKLYSTWLGSILISQQSKLCVYFKCFMVKHH